MKYLTMTGFTVRTSSDRWALGYEGENNSRTLQIKTTDDLTDFATVNLLIDTLDCGAMTVTTVGNFKVLSMVLTAGMLGEAGKKTCQLLMMDSEGTVIKKTNQFYMVVGRSNVIEGTVPDSERIVIITDYIEEKVGELLDEIPLDHLPIIPTTNRTTLGRYAELVGYGNISIDTQNKTVTTNGFTFKCGSYRANNSTIDFSNLATSHQSIYYDFDDKIIKIINYANYGTLQNKENTAYLGSVWASNSYYPKGYFSINTNMGIIVDGVKQLPLSSYFRGKTIDLYGDSICLGRTTSGGTTTHLLHEILAKEYGIKATNYAVGGACWCHRDGMSHDLSALVTSSTITSDFILLFAGTNDYGTNKVLGTINDTPSGDVGNTFYAALHYVLQYIFSQKPNAEVAMVTPTFRSYVSSGGSGDTYNTIRNSAGCTLGDYSDAMIEIAKLYNVPILDMRKMGPINKFNYASMLEEQSAGNGLYLHPKDATYDILYHKICNWLVGVL